MNKLIYIVLLLAGLSCVVHSIEVFIREERKVGHAFGYLPILVDDGITVGQLAQEFIEMFHIKSDKVTLKNHHSLFTYKMDKTLKEAGIRDGSKLIIMY